MRVKYKYNHRGKNVYKKENDMEIKKSYQSYVKRHAPKSPCVKNSIKAFLAGGTVCCIGEGFFNLYIRLGASEDNAPGLVSLTLMAITMLLTGIGVFDKLAKHAGAGTLVPITGFANAMISQAIDSKSEGFITGVGAKMFTVAGPVIVYGTAASVLYGFIYWITTVL